MGGTFRFIDTRDGGSGITFDFGEIQSISTTYTASLTTVPIVVYGYRNTMCIDTGVKKDLSISYIRVNPTNPDDSSATDSSRWSNAKWLREIKDAMNRWQVYTDGFQVTYTMDSADKDLFPDIDDNVYVSSITFPISNASPQYISGQISLKVGSLTTSSSDVPTQYTLRFYRSQGSSEYFDITVPSGSNYPIPNPSSSWSSEEAENLNVFSHWVATSGASGNYRVGDLLTVTSDCEFYAVWVTGRVYVYFSDSTHTISADAESVALVLCGGGGGGACGNNILTTDDTNGGGGGAGGGTATATYPVVTLPATLTLHVGAGGTGGVADSIDGGAGGDTYIDGIALRGYGGDGADGYLGGVGANGGYDGGNGAYKNSYYTDIVDGTAGGGIYGGDRGSTQTYACEGGGGGSLGYDDITAYLAYLETAYGIVPAGGKGGRASVFAGGDDGADGYFGCGGGGGGCTTGLQGEWFFTNGGDGGDGFIMIVEFI